ncbi:MAG: hypothetical protein R2780_00405 [Crocinitomicaceae bacterium]
MKKLIILSLGLLTLAGCKKEGCTDPLAENYSKKAKVDDGSCSYADGVITLEITENITTPTTIKDQTVKICSDISISSDLVIQPGAVIIMCAGASIEIENTGSINAVGTAQNPIVIKGEVETPGYWEGMSIRSNNPNNKLHYVTIKDAGSYWGWEYANVYLPSNAKLELQNSTISNSQDVGLFVDESASLVNFNSNTFSNCVTGLNLTVKQVDDLDAASTYNSNNTNNYVRVRDAVLTQSVTWKKIGTPYLLNGMYVEADLTIEPGVIIWMEADSYIEVRSTGSLKAVGTSTDQIIIKGRVASAGFWSGIKIGSTNANNKFTYAQIMDGGGYWGYEYANVYVNGNVEIDNATVSNANSWGMYISNSSIVKSNGAAQTTAAGVESYNTFNSNGAGADANCSNGCGVNFE